MGHADGCVVYNTAALGVVYDKDRHEQLFFKGHDDDITALDMHPDCVRVVTGQVGKEPVIHVWNLQTMEVQSILKGQSLDWDQLLSAVWLAGFESSPRLFLAQHFDASSFGPG